MSVKVRLFPALVGFNFLISPLTLNNPSSFSSIVFSLIVISQLLTSMSLEATFHPLSKSEKSTSATVALNSISFVSSALSPYVPIAFSGFVISIVWYSSPSNTSTQTSRDIARASSSYLLLSGNVQVIVYTPAYGNSKFSKVATPSASVTSVSGTSVSSESIP